MCSFRGRAIEALLDSNGNVFEVFVDGVSVGLINTTSGVRQYTVASGLSTGTHDDDDDHSPQACTHSRLLIAH